MNKITVAILDDDIIARNTIKELLEDTEYEVIKEFQHPEKFLEWINENNINILLCDMMMPTINGLELFERLRVTHKYLSIIAISSFDDFEIARGCLKYGVEDYLLKAGLDKKKLTNTLNRVCEKNQIVSDNQEVYSNIFESNEEINNENISMRSNIPFNINSVTPIVFMLNFPILESSSYPSYRKENNKAFIDIVNQVLLNNYPYVIQLEKGNKVTVYLSFPKENNYISLIKRITKSFVEKTRRKTKRLLDLSVFVVQGNNESFSDCYMKRNDRLNKMLERLYLVDDFDISSEPRNKADIEGYIFKEQSISMLKFSLETAYEDFFNKVLDCIFDEMIITRVSKCNLIMVAEKMLKLIEVNSSNIVNQIDDISQFKEFIKEKYLLQIRHNYDLLNKKYSPSILQLLLYIQKNYKEDYSLSEYANKIGVSYTHLSRMFKKETGLRFSEYSNLIKVNQAKLLLIKGDNSIKFISEETGFKGYNYFFKVFKDVEGLTPIEFMAKNCSN